MDTSGCALLINIDDVSRFEEIPSELNDDKPAFTRINYKNGSCDYIGLTLDQVRAKLCPSRKTFAEFYDEHYLGGQ